MDLIYFVKYAYVFCDAKQTNSSRIKSKKKKIKKTIILLNYHIR